MRYRDLLTEQAQSVLILIAPNGKVETFHTTFGEFIQQRGLPHIGPLLDQGNVWCNFGSLDFIHIYWRQVTPRQITALQQALHELGADNNTPCDVNANGVNSRTTVGRLAIASPKPKPRRASRQLLAAEQMQVEILDDDLAGNKLSRVVWDKTATIEAHDPSTVSLADRGNEYPGIYALHVGDVDFWFHKLIDDYGNDTTAWEVEIRPTKGDVLVEDVQYAIPDESGNKAYSAILLTTRAVLREGKDFRYVRQLVDERTEQDEWE